MFIHKSTVRFYLRTSGQEKRDGYPVYCRITYKRRKSEFSTKLMCQQKFWSDDSNMPIRKPRLTNLLEKIRQDILQSEEQLTVNNYEINAKLIKEFYLNGKLTEVSDIHLLEYLEKFIATKQNSPDYTKGTLQHYRTTCKHLVTFYSLQDYESIAIDRVNLSFIKSFDNYLTFKKPSGLGISRNTANKYHKKVKKLLNEAINEELITQNPYKRFPLKDEKVNITHLTREELEILENHPLGENESLRRVRDIFLFSTYTGIRFADAQNLVANNISVDNKGNYWIEYRTRKTNEDVSIPMLKGALRVYHKYEDLRKITGKILPQLVNQKVNAYLKTIADLVGINKKLTHNVSRHTFATTITLEIGIPLEVVSSLMGHQSIKTTQRYAQVTRKNKLLHINKINSSPNED